MQKFTDKVVIITGSGAGMGKEAALLFAEKGARVITNSRTNTGNETRDEIVKSGGEAIFIRADVSCYDECVHLITRTVEAYGRIDVLVNAAGIVVGGNVENAQIEDWDRSMDTNAKSVFLLSRLAMPYLRISKGTIVNVCSTVAVKGVKNRAIYSASKGAMLALSQSMAAEYVSEGIRVNCVSPGTVYSPSFEKRVKASPDPQLALKQFIERQPMGRLGTSKEVAEAIVFASGIDVPFMTGANIVVDGGMTI